MICNKCKIDKDISCFAKRVDVVAGKTYTYLRKVCRECKKPIKKPTKFIQKKVVENNPRYNFNMEDIKKYSYGDLRPLKIPDRCSYDLCNCIIPIGGHCAKVKKNGKVIKYCNSWCMEMQEEYLKPLHFCKTCGVAVTAYKRYAVSRGEKYINSSGVYPKYCKECSPYRKRELQ